MSGEPEACGSRVEPLSGILSEGMGYLRGGAPAELVQGPQFNHTVRRESLSESKAVSTLLNLPRLAGGIPG